MSGILRRLIQRIKYGYEIGDSIFIAGGARDEWIILCDNKKVKIASERLDNGNIIIYYRRHDKWLPPNEAEIPDETYSKIVNALANHLQRTGNKVDVKGRC